MKMNKGLFISVEGMDGSGKSTNIDFICAHLKAKLAPSSIDVIQTREPGGTALGEKVREVILNRGELDIQSDAELLMIFAARSQHVNQLIKPHLERGQWVVSDRFTDASFAYQGAGQGIDLKRIEALEHWTLNDFKPDLTFILDIDLDTSLQRTRARDANIKADYFEQQADLFKQRVQHYYKNLCDSTQSEHKKRICRIDANLSLAQVQAQLAHELDRFLKAQA